MLIQCSNSCWNATRYRWNNAGSRTRAGTVLTVGEGDTNVIVGEIIEYFPRVDNNVPLPSTLERLDSEVLQPLQVADSNILAWSGPWIYRG